MRSIYRSYIFLDPMQKQFKIIAIAGMIAIIAGIAGATAIEQAQAQQAATNPVNPNAPVAKAYGTKTAGVVCGDRLCGDVVSKISVKDHGTIEEITTDSSDSPTTKLLSVQKYAAGHSAGEGISYKITFRVTAGDSNLRDIQIHGQSDIDTIDHTISSLSALKSSVQVVRIHAIDADSISGKIVSYSLTGPTSADGPR